MRHPGWFFHLAGSPIMPTGSSCHVKRCIGMAQVCFRRGYNTNGLPTEQEAIDYSGKRHLESGVNENSRRTLRQLSLPGGLEDPLYMSEDNACKEYLVFVGSRVNLLQVRA